MRKKFRIKVETDPSGKELFYPQRRVFFIFPFIGWWEGGFSCFPSYSGAVQRINNWKELDKKKNSKTLIRYIENF